jgi:hypothetical protein
MPRYQAELPGIHFLQQHPTSPSRPMISASAQDTSARPAMPPLSHSVGSPQHHGSQNVQGTHQQSVSHQNLSSVPHQQPASSQQESASTQPMRPDYSHPSSSHHDHHGTHPLGSSHHGGGYSDSQSLAQRTGSQGTQPLSPSHHGLAAARPADRIAGQSSTWS